MDALERIPPRRGRAQRLVQGQTLRIINTHGSQVVDFWAFSAEDPLEFLSMEHLRASLGRIFPKAGDALVTNRRRPILTLTQDTSPGVHDTLIAACDSHRYAGLGCRDYHENCTDNLHAAMRAIGQRAPECPSPLNLWMNIPVDATGNVAFEAPVSKPGDYVDMRAEMDCIAVMSACPQDMLPINGEACTPAEAHYKLV